MKRLVVPALRSCCCCCYVASVVSDSVRPTAQLGRLKLPQDLSYTLYGRNFLFFHLSTLLNGTSFRRTKYTRKTVVLSGRCGQMWAHIPALPLVHFSHHTAWARYCALNTSVLRLERSQRLPSRTAVKTRREGYSTWGL